ncbi:GNAT family N-acetyltransferase [Thiolapillus sp.]
MANQGNPEHVRAIRRLWNDNLRFVADGRYEWLYRDNPAGDTLTCLAVHEEKGEIVGMASAMRRDFHFEGEPCRAGIAIDFAIDAEYRVFGPALLLQRTLVEKAWEQGLDFMLGFPNLAAQGVIKRLGYSPIGSGVRFSRLIRSRGKLKELFSRRRIPGWLAVPASLMLDTGLRLQGALGRIPGEARVLSTMDELDGQWESLWRDNSGRKRFQGVHGEQYVSWRYARCPYKDFQLFALLDEGQLQAFLVFSHDAGVVLVDDFRYRHTRWIRPLFQHFWRRMHGLGHSVINVGLVASGEMERLMKDAGFVARSSPRWGGILSNPEGKRDWAAILRQGDWYVTDGEIDL